jgi:hypothetical protein
LIFRSHRRHRSSTGKWRYSVLWSSSELIVRLMVVLRWRNMRATLPPQTLTHRSRKLNSSPSTVEDKEMLKKMLTTPPIKKIDLVFPLGLEVTARNLRGVTIKDALDAIYKQFKKKVRFRHPERSIGRDGILIFPYSPTMK